MSHDADHLPKTWKKRYPFRTGTTSFIYPAGYRENVARLGPYLDEIELLMFESKRVSRPGKDLIDDLIGMGDDLGVSYNIHLPTDLHPVHPDRTERQRAINILAEFISTLLPLSPSVFVLHLEPTYEISDEGLRSAWQDRAVMVLEEILQTGLPARCLALENLAFPFDWLDPLIEQFDLSVCLDIGHLGLQSGNLRQFLSAYASRIAIAHLHGLREGRDHGPLTGLPEDYRTPLTRWLRGFTGTVSLEVFAYQALLESLNYLDELMASDQ